MDNVLRSMQGVWRIESALDAGEPVAQGEAHLHVVGDRFERRTPNHTFERTIRVEEQPFGAAWIDLEITNEPGLGAVLLGIVEVVGDRMRICHAHPGGPRPTAFSSTAADRYVLSVSRKVAR